VAGRPQPPLQLHQLAGAEDLDGADGHQRVTSVEMYSIFVGLVPSYRPVKL
jgi:hypothetical protein